MTHLPTSASSGVRSSLRLLFGINGAWCGFGSSLVLILMTLELLWRKAWAYSGSWSHLFGWTSNTDNTTPFLGHLGTQQGGYLATLRKISFILLQLSLSIKSPDTTRKVDIGAARTHDSSLSYYVRSYAHPKPCSNDLGLGVYSSIVLLLSLPVL